MSEVGQTDDFAAAFQAAFARLQVQVERACGEGDGWAGGVAAGIGAALDFAEADPAAARLLTNEALAHRADGIRKYNGMISHFAERLSEGRGQRPHGKDLPEVIDELMAGGVATLVAQRLDQGEEDQLHTLAAELVQFVLTPYLGTDEARKVAAASSG
jgi:hypothetical protein